MLQGESATNTLMRTLRFTREEARSECVQLAICLHLRLVCMKFSRATEAAKRSNKKIGSCAVDTDVVVLVMCVVQQ